MHGRAKFNGNKNVEIIQSTVKVQKNYTFEIKLMQRERKNWTELLTQPFRNFESPHSSQKFV